MKRKYSDLVYFIFAFLLFINGIIVKYFLVDTDLGTRFKGFNHRLLSSDIIFIIATFFVIVGVIFWAIRSSKKSTLSEKTIVISALLLIPISFILALTPFFETYLPGKDEYNILGSILANIAMIGTFACFAWVFLFVVIIVKQFFIIFSSKE